MLRNRLRLAIFTALAASSAGALEIRGRLPGELFREDNPPKFGAQMSFASRAGAQILLHARQIGMQSTISDELHKIAKSFKIKFPDLRKMGIIEGTNRWLQYSFQKTNGGGGVIYITRRNQWIVYVVVFNLAYDSLSIDLPYVDRYVQQLEFADEPATAEAD